MNLDDFANLSYDQLVNDVADQVVKIQDAISRSDKSFLGTVVSITKEQSSTRGVVVLHTGTDRDPNGNETVRTDRTDDPDGLMMARKVRALRGHKVLVYVELEPSKDGQRKFRVLRHIVDKGIDPEMGS
jgi:hypothetical protein